MTAIVLEQYQRQGILAKLTRQMGQLIEGREIIGLHSYAVTTHTGSQKNGLQRGSFETGFLIPEFPATMAAKGIQSDCLGDKNPALTLYTPLTKPETRNCYVIASYRDAINEIYCRVGYSRIVLTSGHDKLPEISETIVDSDKRKGVERLEFKSIGKDWKTVSQHIREAAKASDHNAGYYIDIPVSQAAAIPLAQLLKSEQWCFGCILFERNNGDYLRMQYSKAKINRESLRLETAEAARLMHDVLDERKKTLKHPA
ncbi:hypothetical protein [Sinobacterium caligoides]|nr:hypothetical protein [Sinobacterium caligoides]